MLIIIHVTTLSGAVVEGRWVVTLYCSVCFKACILEIINVTLYVLVNHLGYCLSHYCVL